MIGERDAPLKNPEGPAMIRSEGVLSGSEMLPQPIMLHETPANALGYLVDLQSIDLAEGDVAWLQAFPMGTWDHPVYGKIDIDIDRVRRFADNVKKRVRGQDLDINYDHRGDPAKGNKAAGWVVDADPRPDGLWLGVQFTDTARKEIAAGEWKYFSPEFVNEWEHPSDGAKHKDVLFGGGLTNRPFLKGILPLNLSEVFETRKEGSTVDRVKLIQLLGLSEDASDEDILSGIQQLSEQGSTFGKVTKALELNEGDDPLEAIKALKEPVSNDPDPVKDVVKQLGEDTPAGRLLQKLSDDNAALASKVTDLIGSKREADVERKLSEIDVDGKRLTPVQRQDFKETLLASPDSAHANIFKLAEDVAKSAGVAAGTQESGGRSRSEETATKRFNDRVAEIIKTSDDKLNFGDAVEMVSREDPQLFSEYRAESYSREEA
jgi:phage I-like protein